MTTYHIVFHLHHMYSPIYHRTSSSMVCKYPVGRIGIRYFCKSCDDNRVHHFLADIGYVRHISKTTECIFLESRMEIRQNCTAMYLDLENEEVVVLNV